MDISYKKLSLIRWLAEINDIVLINKIEKLRNTQTKIVENQNPISIDNLIARHKISESDIVNNNTIDQKNLTTYYNSRINE